MKMPKDRKAKYILKNAQESSPGVNERKDKQKRGEIGQENSTNIYFLTFQIIFSSFTVLLTTEAKCYLSYDRKSQTHWVGRSIDSACCTIGKDTSIWRTVHRRCTKSPARAFAVYVAVCLFLNHRTPWGIFCR